MNFVKVFDLLDSGFKSWTFSSFSLIFVMIGLGFFLAPIVFNKFGISYLGFKTKSYKIFSFIFLGFSLFFFATTFISTYSEYRFFKKILLAGACNKVEGPVENFDPMPYSGHKMESYMVKGIKFSYSDFVVTNAFNHTKSHGGPVGPDSYVRICYATKGSANYILRLEVRDYSGSLKDYGKPEWPFPKFEELEKSGGENYPAFNEQASWIFGVMTLIYLLDTVGILLLFPPYLDFFISIGKTKLDYIEVPSDLSESGKLNLKHTKLSLDIDKNSIWMRARGINFFHCPMVVAKWTLDRQQNRIVQQEIKYSSGIVLFLIAMLFAFWAMTKGAFEDKNFYENPVMMIMGIFFLVALPINMKMFGKRMRSMAEEVIREFQSMDKKRIN